MPKRQKESKLLPGEGRPTGGLNLGDFLAAKVPQTQKTTQQHPLPSSLESDFPNLSLSSSSEAKTNSTPGVWGRGVSSTSRSCHDPACIVSPLDLFPESLLTNFNDIS